MLYVRTQTAARWAIFSGGKALSLSLSAESPHAPRWHERRGIVARRRLSAAVVASLSATISLFLLTPNAIRFPDEADNLLGAYVLLDGGTLYADYFSHHMPGMYWLSLPAAVMGIADPLTYRLYFYLIVALVFGALAYRHRPTLGFLPVVVLPILYAGTLAANSTGLSFTVLADQAAALALIAIVLEIVSSVIRGEVDNAAWFIAGAAAVGATWFTAVALYSTGAAFLTLLALGIQMSPRANKRRMRLSPLSLAVLGVAIPAAALVLFQTFTGGLGLLKRYAYDFNREVYSTYIADFASTPFTPVYKASTHAAGLFIGESPVWQISYLGGITALGLVIFNVFALTGIALTSRLAAAGLALTLFLSLTRGSRDIHAIPYWGVSAALAAVLMALVMNQLTHGSLRTRIFGFGMIAVIMAFYITPYALERLQPALSGQVSWTSSPNKLDRTITKTLPPRSSYLDTTNDIWSYVSTGVLPASRTAIVFPWTMDWQEQSVIDDLSQNTPEIIVHNPDYTVWGYEVADYAPKLNTFVTDNYALTETITGADGQPVGIWRRR